MKPKKLSPRFLSPLVLGFLTALAALVAAPVQGGVGVWTPVGPGRPVCCDDLGIGAVVADAAQPGFVWAGMPRGGLYRSLDHGVSWHWAGRPLTGAAVRAAAADPSAPGTLWVATLKGLYSTADEGAHWALRSGPDYTALLGYDGPVALSIVPGRPTTFFIRTGDRILASDDDGRSWRVALGTVYGIPADALALGARPTYYVAVVTRSGDDLTWGLLSTTDGGRTWKALSTCPALATGIARLAASVDALYVLPVEGESLGLLRSRDGGATWKRVLGGRPGEPFKLYEVKVDPAAPRTVWVIGDPNENGAYDAGLWVSRDGGGVWRQRSQPPVGGALTIGPDAIYTTDGRSLASSRDDGWTWRVVLRTPDGNFPPAQISFHPGDPSHLMVIVGERIYNSVDGGQTWSLLASPPVNDVWIDPLRPRHMFAVGWWQCVVTNDRGRSWTRPTHSIYSVDLLESPGGRTIFAGACGVDRSRDGGESWENVLPCLGGPRVASASSCDVSGDTSCESHEWWVQKIEVDPAHPQVVYALDFWVDYYPDHEPYYQGQSSELWRSGDGGDSWQLIATGVDAFALDRTRSRVYVSRDRDLSFSDDGGKTWWKRSQMPSRVTDLTVPTGMPFTLYAAAGSALLRSRDAGRTWETFYGGIAPGTYLLTVHPTDGHTVFARSADGVFHMRLP